MKLTVLGCSGGIGSGRHTTCLKVDDDVLIDAGTGITTLDFEALLKIDHVFITHAHLDHVLGLPLLLDSVGDMRATPVTVHALPEVLDVLATHLFNWKLWPDFREIPSREAPWMRFETLGFGEALTLKGRSFRPLPVNHVVPACGLYVATADGSLVFSGDTTHSDAFVAALNAIPDLRHLIIETSFENELVEIAKASKHHWPDSLAAELHMLSVRPEIWITHL
ncbi:MAG: 3',5'-cyclic-nucleotide phosphodiesterase, partial [Thiobacillus sp. GWE1_62_9]